MQSNGTVIALMKALDPEEMCSGFGGGGAVLALPKEGTKVVGA